MNKMLLNTAILVGGVLGLAACAKQTPAPEAAPAAPPAAAAPAAPAPEATPAAPAPAATPPADAGKKANGAQGDGDKL